MKIRTNMSSLRAFRSNSMTNKALAKNLEKLSSGYQINRAGDDAAGLSISEKMRAEITELDRCQNNVSEGLDLARTAEGALQEINDMLRRARGLCIEAKNGTYSDQELAAISDELNQLFSEIDRITASSKYNSIPLFRGDISDHYRDVYNELFNEVGPDQMERWGQMEFVQDKDFDEAPAATPAQVVFKLSDGILPSNSSAVLEGKSITIGGRTYQFTSNTTGVRYPIDLKSYTTVEAALSALASSSSSVQSVSITDDGTVTLKAPLSTLTVPVYADGKLLNFRVPDGDGESRNGIVVQNPLGMQTIEQVDGAGTTNNQVTYSDATCTFDISKLNGPLTQNDIDLLKGNSLEITMTYPYSTSNSQSVYTTIRLASVPFTVGMTKEQVGNAIAKAISDQTNGSIKSTATYDSANDALQIAVYKLNGGTRENTPLSVSIREIKPSSSSTVNYIYDDAHSWTSTALPVGFTLVSAGTLESGPKMQITIPQLPSGPFSFRIGGMDHLYYNSSTHPLTTPGYDHTEYSSWPDYRHDTSSMSSSDVQNNVIQEIVNYYRSYYSSEIASGGITVSGNVITITGNPGSFLPTNNLVSSWTTKVRPYKTEITPGTPIPSEYMLSDGTSKSFEQNAEASFDLGTDMSALAGKGFSIGDRYFEFTNGAGTGINSNYIDVDISTHTTPAEVAAFIQSQLSSVYTVSATADHKLKFVRTANSSSYLDVTDGEEGIIAEGSLEFSGGKNAGHSQTTLDFSSINESNLDTLLGKGFRINCATCKGEYINVFFCWENDGTMPEQFQRWDDSSQAIRTIHNIPVELSKVTNGAKIVESIVNQVRPSLTHYTDVAIGDPPTTLIAMEKRVGPVQDQEGLHLGKLLTGMETNFTYEVEYVRAPDLPADGSVKLFTADVQIYVGSEPVPQLIPIHLPYIDLEWLRLNPPEVVDLNAADQDAADWLARVDRANIAISDARGTIGADFNRLEHAYEALAIADEQLTDAESRIRDADMAELMMDHVKLQILSQSQQTMMAQANNQPQQVLQLLA